ncbi:MAG: YadA C-terminal domain-containing protein, partial [Alphaproteobacteria bacterium]|nr:YadA C-terminal domain-containing protein [Alphaproteobacteria bacterium]
IASFNTNGYTGYAGGATNLTQAITQVDTALGNEVTRATNAENAIASDLADEVTRATNAENKLTTDLTAEVTRAKDAEQVLTNDLASEVLRATTAEGNVASFNTNGYTGYAGGAVNLTQAITQVDTALGLEVTRATGAEEVLTNNLSAEVSRAKDAEQTLQDNIDAEATTRQEADSVLQQNIDALDGKVTANLGTISSSHGNLYKAEAFSVRNTVADNLMSLDAAIGDRNAINNNLDVFYGRNGIRNKTISEAISQIASNIGVASQITSTIEGGIKSSYTVNQNIAALNTLISELEDESEDIKGLIGQYSGEHANVDSRYTVIANLENLGDTIGNLANTRNDQGYLDGHTVAQDLKNLDNEIKRVGDFTKDADGNYTDSQEVYNLKKSDTVVQNLMNLDKTIGQLEDGRHLDADSSVAANLTNLDNAVSNLEDHVGTWDETPNAHHENIDTSASLTANVEALGDMIGKMSEDTQGNINGGAFDATNTVAANLEKLDQAIGNLSGTGVLDEGDTDTSVAHQLSTLNSKIGATQEVIGDIEDLNKENGHFTDDTKTVVDALNALDKTIGSLGNTMVDGQSNDNSLRYVADADYDSATDEKTERSVSDNLAALDRNLARVDDIANEAHTALGGEFADGVWNPDINTNGSVSYGTLDVHTVQDALTSIKSTIGSANDLSTTYNGVTTDKSVNANIAAVNQTLGDFTQLNGTIDDVTGAKVLSTNLTNGSNVEGNSGYKVPANVVDALNNIDATLGTVHGLAESLGDNHKGNLAAADNGRTTVSDHLTSLDASIGDRSAMTFDGYAEGGVFAGKEINYTMPTGDDKLSVSDSISYVASHIGTADQLKIANGTDEDGSTKYEYVNGVSGSNTVNQNFAAMNTTIGDVSRLREAMYASNRDMMGEAIDTSVTDAISNLDTHLGNLYNYTEKTVVPAINTLHNRYRKLRKDFEAGMASMAAMSALAPNARAVGDTQLSVGTGAYSGHTAAAVGAYHWLTDNLMLNIGAAWGGDSADNVYRMGVTYSW